jgi:2,3-diketo-5-methylthiopentyl-1-phosphate enolase
MDHPNGPGAGVNAFFQALDWYQQGLPFNVNKMPPGALKQAMEKWA